MLGNPSAGGFGTAISCCCVPLKPEESFQRFGVVLLNAWTVTLEIGDAASIRPQTEVRFSGQIYSVQGGVEIHQNGDEADCAVFVMRQLQFPEAA